MNPYRRWPMTGVANFRDIGGYPCPEGVTRYGVFFRSAHLHDATGSDVELLKKAGVTTVVDLRYPDEYHKASDKLPAEVSVFNYSIMGSVKASEITVNGTVEDTRTLQRMYKQILEFGKQELAAAIRELSRAPGAAVYHCAAGKDRTGLVTMFLLSIAGVNREDIIADYEISHTYVKGFTTDVSGSHYSNMGKAIDWIDRKYDGAHSYLLAIGLSVGDLDLLRRKLVVPCQSNSIC